MTPGDVNSFSVRVYSMRASTSLDQVNGGPSGIIVALTGRSANLQRVNLQKAQMGERQNSA